MRNVFSAVVLAAVLSGCGGRSVPVTAHGKPVSYWVDELQSPNAKARKKAVSALGAVGAADPSAIPALIRALKDPDMPVRDAAVLALLNIGPDAKAALSALNESLSDADVDVRAHAAKAIERIRGS